MPGPGRHAPGRATSAMLNTALGGGLSSRLFQQVREQRGLVYQVYSSQVRYADPEVARAKGPLRGGMVLGLEDAASRMNRLGRSELDHGRRRTLSESPALALRELA